MGNLVHNGGYATLIYITLLSLFRQIVQFFNFFLPTKFPGHFCEKYCLTHKEGRGLWRLGKNTGTV